MHRALREPLLHFVVAGAALFALHAWLAPPSAPPRDRVTLSAGEVRWLEESWAKRWNRAPTREELDGLVVDYLREVLMAREARELGLDQDDTIVRRRLAQKLEFMVADTARLVEPSASDLARFHAAHPELYRAPSRISFIQLQFSSGRHPDAAAAARAALAQLAAGTDPATLGDPSLVGERFAAAEQTAIAAQFGAEFAAALFAAAPGAWQGPIPSAYGAHLVKVSAIEPGRALPLAEVREQVLARWREERERALAARFYAQLLQKYEVTIDDAVRDKVGPLALAPQADQPTDP